MLLITALLSVVIWRFAALKTFLKNHVFLDEYIDTSEALPNHDYVADLLKREISKSERYNFPVSIILLEIAHQDFKKKNEEAFLEALQDSVKRSIRETDVFGFWDDELNPEKHQFICVLPHTDFTKAYDLSERLRIKLSRRLSIAASDDLRLSDLKTTDLNVQEFAGEKNNVSIACGISMLEYFEGLESLIARAVEALEMAKTKGSNCTMPLPPIKEVSITDLGKHLN